MIKGHTLATDVGGWIQIKRPCGDILRVEQEGPWMTGGGQPYISQGGQKRGDITVQQQAKETVPELN